MAKAVGEATNGFHGRCAYTSMGLTLTAERGNPIKPVRVLVWADAMPATNELAALFPGFTNAYNFWMPSRAVAESTGSNSFRIGYNPPAIVAAEDYLKWSDDFADDFDLIREAMKRPYAQLEGDYSSPAGVPVPNFICQRVMAQMLTDRAKCHLLLGQPQAALEDLTMVRGLCRVMEGQQGRPVTLVATMIDVAVTGIYVDAIAEGMRLKAWRDPELAALQEQLKQINLVPMLSGSFEYERASSCHLLESIKPDEYLKTVAAFGTLPKTNLWDKLENVTYLILQVGPRGWVYQNMSRVALLEGKLLECLDTTNRLVSPGKAGTKSEEMQAALHRVSPYNYLAVDLVPNFTRAVQVLAQNQCMADEALVACALERRRLAHGEYPKTLEVLAPEFLEKIPRDIISGQPLKYHLKHGGQFALYSVGWNERDDGGVPGREKDGTQDGKKGDWVWAGSIR